jgi:ribonuclease D
MQDYRCWLISRRVRCSDWEIDVLSPKQIEYASNDAFVAIEIFRKLFKIVKPGHENAEDIRKFCDGYTDMTFKNKLAQMNLDSTNVAAHEKKLLKKGNE